MVLGQCSDGHDMTRFKSFVGGAYHLGVGFLAGGGYLGICTYAFMAYHATHHQPIHHRQHFCHTGCCLGKLWIFGKFAHILMAFFCAIGLVTS